MAIFSRFGSELTLVREATAADVKRLDRRAFDEQDKSRIAYGMLWVCKLDSGEEMLADAAHLRADDGIAEINRARKSIMGEERYLAATGVLN